ncbi:SpoIIE family protein phosphatase [Streptomyces sp. NPDC005811]|uniref:ATP-binding SpoIIE family protein phosphatase n=1 Tax=Streptomyces sp. NPDC005811 TaxID=3154565 RepID=UPI0033C092F1
MDERVTLSDSSDGVRLHMGAEISAVVDGRGVVTACSTSVRVLLGYERGDVIGGKAARMLGGPLPVAVQRHCAQREAWSGLIPVRHRDGRRLRLRIEGQPLSDAAGGGFWALTATAPQSFARDDGTGDSGEPETSVLKRWALEQLPLPMGLYDRRGVCIAVNAAMARAMGTSEQGRTGRRIGHDAQGQPIKGMERMVETVEQVWRTGRTVSREMHFRSPGEARAHAWLTWFHPVEDPAGRVCAVSVTGGDASEQFHARQRLSVLNEAGARIGSTLDVACTADELAQVGTDHFADFVVVDLLDSVLGGEETEGVPSDDRLRFRRVAQRSVLPGCPETVVPIGALHSYHAESTPGRALAEGHALHERVNSRSMRLWAMDSPERVRSIKTHGIHSIMAVPLRARGVTLGLAIFSRHGTPEPFREDDLRLAEELAARAAVWVDNARRYTRERSIALALQESLLLDRSPHQAGVETAFRYLPSDPGVGIGGDWFDVIPLSGARVALVMGDVVGHGIQAAATMGRLCTAVRTLADVDLAPDELLTQLDDLVLRLDRKATADRAYHAGGEVGATCLYAVYDPVSRRCSMARAGHPEPALVTPDGAVEFLHVPAGPPLGLGGLPFEVAEFDIPAGSVIAIYTDGLLADRDLDEGRDALRAVLVGSLARPLETTCDRAVDGLLPDRRADDAALLLVRTRQLGADQVATWGLPAEPAAVARARDLACDQLAAWGMNDAAFATELVVSELVTNAIRYGRPPIHLRLIHDTTLVCEVSDDSNTAPHLRRARVFDEGGRGLFIVAQLTQRWGTRHTRMGKTIWAEVPLPPETAVPLG